MSASRRLRLTALFAGAAVIASSLLAALPAAADDGPTADPTPVVEPIETPAPDATTPAPEPDATPTPTPEATATEAPVAEPVETPTPEPTSTVTEPQTVSYQGILNRLSVEDGEAQDDGTLMLLVEGFGYLRVDVSALPAVDRSGRVRVDLIVPEGLALADDEALRFSQLETYSSNTAALVASDTAKLRQISQRETAGLVTQTPATTAVHEVYVVLVSPNSGSKNTSVQTASHAAELVQFADEYWSEQSGGKVQFHLGGTVGWYKSSYSCKTQSASLWNQAAAKAASLGFDFERNEHLMLLFPPSANCGSAIGLASVGWSVNQGGVLWVKGGSNEQLRMATTAHELGHNLSLGHADWLECGAADPLVGAGQVNNATDTTAPSVDGCEVNYYGDLVDVMGYGQNGFSGGALSSVNAIRSGIWDSSKFVNAPTGTNSYTLQSVSSDAAGTKAVVIQAQDGTNYFVEYRDFTDEDLPYEDFTCYPQSGATGGGACVQNTAGVRVLRMEPSGYYSNPGYQGVPGYDSYLIGHDATEVKWTTTDTTYSLGSGNSVTVTGIGSGTATVSVTRALPTSVTSSDVWIESTVYRDGSYRVGDTLTAFLGDEWNADSYTYQWKTSSHFSTTKTNVSGETGQSYVVRPEDLGRDVWVTVTGKRSGQIDQVVEARLNNQANDPIAIQQGFYQSDQPGSVAVLVTDPLTANPTGWPASTTFQFRWYRGSTASTATTAITPLQAIADYQLTSADAGKFLRVAVTATPPGYAPVTRYSAVDNYTMTSTGTSTIIGSSFAVGGVMTVDNPVLSYSSYSGASLVEDSVSYQWLRNGAPITGNPDATDDVWYTAVGADYGQKISLRITAHKAGRTDNVYTTSQKTVTIKGEIAFSSAAASIDNVFDATAPAKVKLTANITGVTEPGTTLSYQWYRVNRTTGASTAITTAKAQVYKPVAADYPYKLKVRITVSKTNYNSVPFNAERDFSLRPDTTPGFGVGFDGAPVRVDSTIGLNLIDMSFHAEITPGNFNTVHLGDPGSAYTPQWRRAGVNVSGQTGDTYALTAADLGKVMSYTIKVTYDGYLAFSGASPNTVAVAPATFTPGADPVVVQDGVNPLKKTVMAALTDVSPSATSMKYQWFRDGTAISGATLASYTVTSASYGKTVTVRVSYLRAGYTTLPLDGDPGGTGRYWLRADPTAPVLTEASEARVGGTLEVDDDRDYLDMTDAASGGAPVADVDVQKVYQWYRSGVLITTTDATDNDGEYQPVAADKGKVITVKVTASVPTAPGLLPSVATTAATPTIGTTLLDGWNEPLDPVGIDWPATNTSSTTLKAPDHKISTPSVVVKYQWYRGTTAVSGATASKYKLTTADIGKEVWVRITVTKAASGSTTYTPVVKYSNKKVYSITTTPAEVGFSTLAVGRLVQTVENVYETADGDIELDDLSQTYQWLRNGVAIPGANSWYYTLQAADAGTKISVRITTGNLGGGYIPNVQVATTIPASLTVAKGTLEGDTSTAPTVSVSIPATNTLLATPPSVTGTGGDPDATFKYQWLRDGAAISNATASTYKLSSADRGKDISVRVTATLTGYSSVVLPESTPIDYSITAAPEPASPALGASGPIAVGTVLDVDLLNFLTKDGVLSGYTIAYQWLRNGEAITGATNPTYTLAAADKGYKITARLTVSKAGYITLVHVVPNTVATALGVTNSPTVTVNAVGIGTLGVSFSGLTPATPTPTYTYKWYRANPATPNTVTLVGSSSTYKLVAADADRLISVQVTMKRSGFTVPTTTIPRTGGVDYTLSASSSPTINASSLEVGSQLGVNLPVYTNPGGGVISPALTYQWKRNGTVIAGGENYTLVSADIGATITVTVIANHSGLVPLSATTAGVGPVVIGSLGLVNPSVEISDVGTARRLDVTVTGITQPSANIAYQWFRQTGSATPVAISGQTLATYTLSPTNDYGKLVYVRVTVSKSGYSTQAPISSPTDWSLTPLNGVSVTGDPLVGEVLTVNPPTSFTSHLGSVTPDGFEYQWLRNNVAITSADATDNDHEYTIVAADRGATISVRITASKALLLPWTEVVPSSAPVPLEFAGSRAIPTVSKPATSLVLTAALPSGSVTTSGAVVTYQWHRTGGAIPGATTKTYTLLDPDDYGKTVWVRVTVTKPGYTTLVLNSIEKNYSITRITTLAVAPEHQSPVVNSTMTFDDAVYLTNGEEYVPPASAQTIIWLANGSPVAPEYVNEFNQFTPQAVHVGQQISVQVITTRAGWLTSNATSSETNPVAAN